MTEELTYTARQLTKQPAIQLIKYLTGQSKTQVTQVIYRSIQPVKEPVIGQKEV